MAKRGLSPNERRDIGRAAAAKASAERPDRIVRAVVGPRTNHAGEPEVAMTSTLSKKQP